MRRYFLAPYILIDKDLRVGQAMAASAKMTKKHSGAIWSVIGVTILLSVFQVIPVWGGLITLIATTLYACAPPLRYLELTSKKHPR